MSLSSALNTAKSSLVATQTHTQLVSRNIANLNAAGATRKYANVITGINGGVQVNSVAQSQNSVLFRNMLDSTSSLAATEAVANGLNRISETIGDPELGRSPAALVASLKDKIEAAAKLPNNYELARAAVQAAQDLSTSLNQGAATVETIRRDADDELVAAAKSMNDLLARIKDLNDQVIAGTTGGTDVTDFVDKRDQAVAELSEYVGVTVGMRANNDMVLYTDSGVTLFERIPRPVEFTPSTLSYGVPGNAFKIDGVTVTGDNAFMPIKTGKIAGLVELRDKTAVTYGQQLDEIAGKLRTAFSESDQTENGSAAPLSALAGLFVTDGGTTTTYVTERRIGAFDPSALKSGDRIEFTVQLGTPGTPYTIPEATFTGSSPPTIEEVRSFLQAQITGQVATRPALAAVTVTSNGGVLSLQTASATALDVKLTDVTNATESTRKGGLVTTGTATTVASGPAPTSSVGMAASIKVAASAITNPFALRDGVNGGPYAYNTASLAGFTGRLSGLADALAQSRSYSTTLGAATSGSIAEFAASSFGWLEANRAQATTDSEYKQTLLSRTQETLSDTTGINLAEEMTLLIDLERSYQASSKLISTIDEMLAALLQAI